MQPAPAAPLSPEPIPAIGGWALGVSAGGVLGVAAGLEGFGIAGALGAGAAPGWCSEWPSGTCATTSF